MKNTLLGILLIISTTTFSQNLKFEYIYGKWKQYGYKSFQDSVIQTSKEECANKIIELGKDGKYEEEMYSLVGKGVWQFNPDSTRFGYEFTEYMGQKIPRNDLPISFNSIILKLTRDTLVIGEEAYYGPEMIKGHADWYYLKIK